MNDLPYCQASENNKTYILEKLKVAFADSTRVLEIGSGTGQHAVFFAEHLSHLEWLPSDRLENHQGISAWIDESPSPNLQKPIVFSVPESSWPDDSIDAVFTSNTAHIMQKQEVHVMMQLVSESLPVGGNFCQYGPFTNNGVFSTQSNKDFHYSLVERGYGGYRDLCELSEWAPNMDLIKAHKMPANNLLLHWRKPG